ncbi:hypothetical protein LTR37_003159 [Vermiconidia calcicola]|uniref:Uncharacterized protein n=1 Tax=Vermiconidia calcicola TaxID=1690605 RepID=A0ACC3NT52_9PEZI|nr:hypothetical protein LTR37_003159 [Vermiconidia calcicola]
MFQTAGYPVHPPYFSNYDYKSPPRTPPQNGGYAYYSPRQYSYATPQAKGHTRRPTTDATYTYTTYTTPRKTAHYSGAEYSSPGYYASAQTTPQRKSDYHVYDEPSDRSYEYLPRYKEYEARPPPYKRHQSCCESRADHRYYDQVPIYTQAEPTEKRTRRASHTEYAAKPTHTSTPRRPTTATKAPPKATEDDARRAGIPAGYCYKNWDPTEEPILLLGSVFDANSLGKWIYDWTVFFYGPATPMAEVAGELWLLLIQLAGKIKRAEECMSRIRQQVSRDLVDDFLESGERLWQRFNKLLKMCESYMWKAARKENGTTAKVRMGKNSGCEFVDSIFGRDRELERTEKLMTGMRLWSMRFDANCEEILRNPSA